VDNLPCARHSFRAIGEEDPARVIVQVEHGGSARQRLPKVPARRQIRCESLKSTSTRRRKTAALCARHARRQCPKPLHLGPDIRIDPGQSEPPCRLPPFTCDRLPPGDVSYCILVFALSGSAARSSASNALAASCLRPMWRDAPWPEVRRRIAGRQKNATATYGRNRSRLVV
jgi:hypothetical protein